MIKKLLLMVIVLLFSAVSFSQDIYRAYKLDVGLWNSKTEKFDWKQTYIKQEIYINRDTVRISNELGSYYITTSKGRDHQDKKIKVRTWDAIDNNGKKCALSVLTLKETDELLIVATYNDAAIRWYIITE